MKKMNVVDTVGWFASIMAILMYSSYIDQIRLNVTGNPGSIILPAATTVNCMAWVLYALLKPKKDWPLFLCNILGVGFAIATMVTAVMVAH